MRLLHLTWKDRSKAAGVKRKPVPGEVLLRAENIVKDFPGIWEHLILDHVNFEVRAGEIHALLGENGAGKTVLANILSGFYLPSEGRIYVRGELAKITCPKDALELGIGMVHQEFTLARPFTVAENVALGLETSGFSYPISEVEEKIRKLSKKYGLDVDPKAKIEDLSVGEQQRVEILKVLFYEPDVIILDEPTSVLTQEETKMLFSALRTMADEGHGIVFITHRINEVFEISDRVTVMRLGKVIGSRKTSQTTKEELIRMMMGKEITIPRFLRASRNEQRRIALEVRDLHVIGDKERSTLKGISLSLREGEILGIAGIAGNGQKELLEAIVGLRRVTKGQVIIFDKDVTNSPPREIYDLGVSYIPEDRRRVGISEMMTVAENIILKDYRKYPFSSKGILNRALITKHVKKLVSEFNILVPDLWLTESRILSGGNIQRLILARETWWKPKLIIAAYPTHGLDVKGVSFTHKLFLKLKSEGTAILMVSEDLEELKTLSDRIAVMCEGKIVGILSPETSVEEIGALMTGSKG
ncbi:MAG: heme ABC transporter ATP-binding protein [Thermoproteota archaeon]|nr:MAG: heme ABC transporter ATP-binding protein [Candidatus Korarchaeota archaeon]